MNFPCRPHPRATRPLIRALAALLVLGIWAPTAEPGAIRARYAGAYNPGSNQWLFEQSIDVPVPVASITKVMAAITFLSMVDDLDQLVTIQRDDWYRAGKTRLQVGDRIPARTLLQLALVASDNCAARALANPLALSSEAYGIYMQRAARRIGLRRSVFVEPSGLDERNVATVREVAMIFAEALNYPILAEFLGTTEFEFSTRNGDRSITHSSRFLRYRSDVIAAKTGYLDEAGYCLVQCAEDSSGRIITVVLGAPTKRARDQASARVLDLARLDRHS